MEKKKFDEEFERGIDRAMRVLRGRVAEGTLNTAAFKYLLNQAWCDEPFLLPYAVQATPAYPKDLREFLREARAVSDSAYNAEKLEPFCKKETEDKRPRICHLAFFLQDTPFETALKKFRGMDLVAADANTFLGAIETDLFRHGTASNIIIAGSSVKYWGGDAKPSKEDMPVYVPGDGFEIRSLDWVMKDETTDPIKKCYLVHQHVY